jgi:hypothetical protein
MLLDDRPADREPHTHAIRLRREECVEQSAHILRFDPDPGILYRDEYLIVAVLTRSYLQIAAATAHGTQGLDSVHQKIHHDLVQLNAVPEHGRQRRSQVSA